MPNGYADGFWQLRAIHQNATKHREDASYEEYQSRFNATRDLFEQAQEEEMGSPEVQRRGGSS